MRRRPRRGDPVAGTGLEVRRRGEAREVRRARRVHRGLLVGPPPAHLHQGATGRGGDHPRRCGRDGAVVVEDRQHERLEDHRLVERAGDAEHGGAGEVQLALRVALDVTGEAVAGEPAQGPRVEHRFERGELRVGEPERRDRVEHPGGARDHAVAAAVGKLPSEGLEGAVPPRGAVRQRACQHRQLVLVGEQRRARGHGDQPMGPAPAGGPPVRRWGA